MKIRSLKRFDGKCVRITEVGGDVFEGNCDHFSAEFSAHEYGPDEEGLKLGNYLFHKYSIARIEVLKDRGGPWGKFSGPYGTLELETASDADLYEDMLDSEDNEHVLRLLRCLNALFEHGDRPVFKSEGMPVYRKDGPNGSDSGEPFVPDAAWRAEAIDVVRKAIKYMDDPEIRAEAEKIVKRAEE